MAAQRLSRSTARLAEKRGYTVVGVAAFKQMDGFKIFAQRTIDGKAWNVGSTGATVSRPLRVTGFEKALDAADSLIETAG